MHRNKKMLTWLVVSLGGVFYGNACFAEHDRDRAVLEEHHIPHGDLPAQHETHASTITQAADGTLIAAWFGGSRENAKDVKIWASRKEPGDDSWSQAFVVDSGNRMLDGQEVEFACWNPVLITHPDGTIYLYYKISGLTDNPGYRNWWGAVKTSRDQGKSWSERIWLPRVGVEGEKKVFEPYAGRACGPVKNRPLIMPDGSLLCGASTETEHGWRVHFELYQANDWTGEKHGCTVTDVLLEGKTGIQPSFLLHSDDYQKLQVLTREDGQAWSEDGGKTWTEVTDGPIDTSKGLHAITLRDRNWHFLVFNPSDRTPCSLARSRDGQTWETIIPDLNPGHDGREDYPTIMRAADGNLHVVHSWGRDHIRHLVLDTEYLCSDGQ